jgi:hypothetical protein
VVCVFCPGDAYRKDGRDDYGDKRFRQVLAAACGINVKMGGVLDQPIIATIARVALVEVVVSIWSFHMCLRGGFK